MSNDNRGRVTREKQVTSNSQLEAQASPTRLNSHTVSNTFSKNVSFCHWWEVAVLFSGITTALIERQELRCMRVRPTEREMCGSSLLSCTFCYFLGLVRGTLGHSTQVSEHKLHLDLLKLKRVSDQEIVNLKKSPKGKERQKVSLCKVGEMCDHEYCFYLDTLFSTHTNSSQIFIRILYCVSKVLNFD